jgi:energy-coupling factor transporter ATP-binding protein EcfA2
MKLLRFRVQNFRSVIDSGWIETDNVTALIGTNESGKTNLLTPLWKLKPAKDGEINPMADYPRKRYGEIRSLEKKPVFITAQFQLPPGLAARIAKLASCKLEDVNVVEISRDFGGQYYIGFPEASPLRQVSITTVTDLLEAAYTNLSAIEEFKGEQEQKTSILTAIAEAKDALADVEVSLGEEELALVQEMLTAANTHDMPKTSRIKPAYDNLLMDVQRLLDSITRPSPNENEGARKAVLAALPSFVYYSNYGNLDSEIYLPHVVENMTRENLGVREEAKARTLKVLFEFVKLKPKEILELGKDYHHPQNHKPSDEEIQRISERKKERDILLQSASTDLTQKFRDWWKQGEYIFRFHADGDHFRIWVSDKKRPEEIELEGRSSGLIWFFSFYLIFLVESQDAHAGAILLLDEPGISLHPLAQEDLSTFFDNLAQTNQLVYTTHSPFMVDPDHLDRVKAVYVDDGGATAVSPDLRANEKQMAQSHSIYPVYAALGLSISRILLVGCQIVMVEGVSDQYYLSAMKLYLISKGLIAPPNEILFFPADGVRGIKAIVSILVGRNESLPYIVLDADKPGQDLKRHLRQSLYSGQEDQERILLVDQFTGLEDSEIEDMWPVDYLADVITKYLRGPEEDFSDVVQPGKPIISQVEDYAAAHNIEMETGWKVEIAKRAKTNLLKKPEVIDQQTSERWQHLFAKLLA